jgi:hypothetical protein
MYAVVSVCLAKKRDNKKKVNSSLWLIRFLTIIWVLNYRANTAAKH